MGHQCLVEEALEAGLLMRVSEEQCSTGRALVVELPHISRRHPELDQVIDVLCDNPTRDQHDNS